MAQTIEELQAENQKLQAENASLKATAEQLQADAFAFAEQLRAAGITPDENFKLAQK